MYEEKKPLNPVTNGPQKFGGINRVVLSKGSQYYQGDHLNGVPVSKGFFIHVKEND